MAKKTSRAAAKAATKTADSHEEIHWPFGPKNYLIFAIALVVIVIGFVLLGQGDITLSVLLLTMGYCVLLPIAIMANGKAEKSPASDPSGDSPQAIA
jgi:hypothetical protein